MIKHEYDAWNEFEQDFHSAIALLGPIQDSIISLHQDHPLADAVFGIQRLFESAQSHLNGGRIYGEIKSNDGT